MKIKLIVLLALCSAGLDATWTEDAYAYYSLARYIISEKIKTLNPFAKKEATVAWTPVAEKPVIWKKYKRKYDSLGRRIGRRR